MGAFLFLMKWMGNAENPPGLSDRQAEKCSCIFGISAIHGGQTAVLHGEAARRARAMAGKRSCVSGIPAIHGGQMARVNLTYSAMNAKTRLFGGFFVDPDRAGLGGDPFGRGIPEGSIGTVQSVFLDQVADAKPDVLQIFRASSVGDCARFVGKDPQPLACAGMFKQQRECLLEFCQALFQLFARLHAAKVILII